MSDGRLRELERLWRESGSVEDEVAYLQERVRVGEQLEWQDYSRLAELDAEAAADYLGDRMERGGLQRIQVELAAYCAHEPARLALGQGDELPAASSDLDWLWALRKFGKAFVRLALALTFEAALPTTDPSSQGVDTVAVESVVAMLLDEGLSDDMRRERLRGLLGHLADAELLVEAQARRELGRASNRDDELSRLGWAATFTALLHLREHPAEEWLLESYDAILAELANAGLSVSSSSELRRSLIRRALTPP